MADKLRESGVDLDDLADAFIDLLAGDDSAADIPGNEISLPFFFAFICALFPVLLV